MNRLEQLLQIYDEIELAILFDWLGIHRPEQLADIALHFQVEPDAARGMLEIWERKGRIVRTKATASCGASCTECDSAATEIYIWRQLGEVGEIPEVCVSDIARLQGKKKG